METFEIQTMIPLASSPGDPDFGGGSDGGGGIDAPFRDDFDEFENLLDGFDFGKL